MEVREASAAYAVTATPQATKGYKQTEVGVIPEDWDVATIGELSSCFSGGTPSTSNSSYYGGNIPWITSGDLNSVRIKGVEGRITADGLANSAASRIFLAEIERHVEARRDFGFETTLAGRGYLRLIQRLRTTGWRVELIYLALPDAEMAKLRVAERVSHGGHDIPVPDIERRFLRSLENLFNAYALLVDRTVCFLNSGETPEIVFTQRGENREVKQPAIMRLLQSWRQI